MRISIFLLTVLVASAASAGPEHLAEAKRLREETGDDWNAGRHAEAAEKLRRADAIYRAEEGDFSADRAVTLRALCWNEVRAGQHDAARATWLTLADVASGRDGLAGEVWSGHIALFEAARTQDSLDAEVAFMEPVRKAALERGFPAVAAQILHSLAIDASEQGMEERALAMLEPAISLRRKAGDLAGLAWSLNNRANALIRMGRVRDALAPTREAWGLVHESGQWEPQFNVGRRVEEVLDALRADSERTAADRAWIAELVSAMAGFDGPTSVPVDRVMRTLIEVDPSPATFELVESVDLHGAPAEVRADLLVRCARAATTAGDAERAGRWLDGLDVGRGPAAPHLAARAETARALVHAASGRTTKFTESAFAAAKAWRELGDRDGREAALSDLVATVRSLGLESSMKELLDEHALLRASGRPGGSGGSASSGGDRSGAAELGPLAPVFRVTFSDGSLSFHDLIADRTTSAAVSWHPRRVGMNGLVVQVFGGYVVVEQMSYGGSTAASGTPGTISLDALGTYLPVPASGALVICKNGATTWSPD